MRLSSAWFASAVVCGFAATSHGQDALVYAANAADGRIEAVKFDPPSSTTFNQDADQRTGLRSLALRDDGVDGLHLIACDTLGGALVDYAGTGNGSIIVSAGAGGPKSPDGVSLDPQGNLTLADSGDDGYGEPTQVWVVLRDLGDAAGHTALPGGYRTPLGVLDDDVNAQTEIGGVPTWVAAEHVAQTLRVGSTRGALSAGDLLVVCSEPAMVLRYRADVVAHFLALLRAQSEGGAPPPPLCPDVFIHPPNASVDARLRFPDGAAPSGIAIGPDGNLLVPTADGKVLIYLAHGERRVGDDGNAVDFTDGLADGPHQITVGPEDGKFRAYLTDHDGNAVLRFAFGADGTGTLDGLVTDGIQGPVGIAATTSTTVKTKSGSNVVIQPSTVLTTTLPKVTTAGVTNARMILFEDPREKELSIPPEEPMHRSLFLDEISDDLPAIEIPPYVRAFPLGDPDHGPPTFILLVVESTAQISGPIVHDAEEAVVLGYDPDCLSPSPWLRPRIFWAPTPDELPILEGGTFIDITARCGSDRGLSRNTFSLLLPGCRDTRDPVEISRTKLDVLAQRLAGADGIEKKVRSTLQKGLEKIRGEFDAGHYARAARYLDRFLSIIAKNPGAFGGSDPTVPSELYARAASAKFAIGLL